MAQGLVGQVFYGIFPQIAGSYRGSYFSKIGSMPV